MTDQEPSAASARTVEETRADARAEGSLLVYERVLPALAVSVERIRGEVGVVLEREKVAADRRADIVLFVSEASTNVVVHAYVATSPGPLYAAATLADRDLIVSVCDCGRGMVPRSDSPGAGLGLPLMARLSDGLWMASDPNGAGTCVHGTFERATRAQASAAAELTQHDDRRAMLREYREAHCAALREDTEAVLAQARHVLARAHRQRRERAARR